MVRTILGVARTLYVLRNRCMHYRRGVARTTRACWTQNLVMRMFCDVYLFFNVVICAWGLGALCFETVGHLCVEIVQTHCYPKVLSVAI